jgi:hypothetical protein
MTDLASSTALTILEYMLSPCKIHTQARMHTHLKHSNQKAVQQKRISLLN